MELIHDATTSLCEQHAKLSMKAENRRSRQRHMHQRSHARDHDRGTERVHAAR